MWLPRNPLKIEMRHAVIPEAASAAKPLPHWDSPNAGFLLCPPAALQARSPLCGQRLSETQRQADQSSLEFFSGGR